MNPGGAITWEFSKDRSALGAHYWIAQQGNCGAVISPMTQRDPGHAVSEAVCVAVFNAMLAWAVQGARAASGASLRDSLFGAAVQALNCDANLPIAPGERPVAGVTFSAIVEEADAITVANIGANTVLLVGELGFNRLLPSQGTSGWGTKVIAPESEFSEDILSTTIELESGQWVLCAPASKGPHSCRFRERMQGRRALESAVQILGEPYPRFAKAWVAVGRKNAFDTRVADAP